MKRNRKRKKPYFPRVVPSVSTSSKTFVDKKTKSRRRSELNKRLKEDLEA